MRKRRPWRALWVPGLALPLWLRELPEDFLPSLPISSRALGSGRLGAWWGWAFRRGPHRPVAFPAQEHPLLKPYRPPALFRCRPRRRPRR